MQTHLALDQVMCSPFHKSILALRSIIAPYFNMTKIDLSAKSGEYYGILKRMVDV